MSQNTDVIIIGAGIAGLRAAAWMGRFGYTVLVLEAKETVGGRIKTIYNQNQIPIEMGANLFTLDLSQKKTALLAYLQQAELTLTPIDIENSTTFDLHGEQKKIEKLLLLANDYYQTAEFKIKQAKEKKTSMYPSLSDILQLKEKVGNPGSPLFIGQQTLTAMIKEHTGASAEKVSLYELMNEDKNEAFDQILEKTYLIQGGCQSLPNLMAREASETGNVFFQLNTPVAEIHRNSKGHPITVVDCRGKSYQANYVICTLPASVLKGDNVHFFPPLSLLKKNLFKNLEIGHQNKVILEFEHIFWPMNTQYLFPGSQDVSKWPEYLNLSYFSNHKTATLIAHYYGDEAKFAHRTDMDIVKEALAPLQKIFGSKISPLRSFMVTRWDTDPYAQGSTSCFSPQFRQKDLDSLATPEPGGLYFAGAYTLANANRETLNGASISGLRAAIAVTAELGRYVSRTRNRLSLDLKNRPNRR